MEEAMRLGLYLVLLGACGTTDGGNHIELRAAVDRADNSLADSVVLAEATVQYSAGVNARIEKALDQFAVGAIATDVRHVIRLDFAGRILSAAPAGAANAGCQTQISLEAALAIAEATKGGDAVQVVPDDDDPCMREIQVLVDTTLWEVKVGPTGTVVETELSDEDI